MRLKMIVFLVAAFCLFAVPSFAGDITGKWVAEREMPKMQGGGPGGGAGGGPGGGMGAMGPMKWTFDLKAEGSKLTGTVQGPFPQAPASDIQEGKIEGNKISFFIKVDMMGNDMKITYNGTVSGDEISFKTTMEGGMGGMGGPGGGPGGNRGERPPLIAKRVK